MGIDRGIDEGMASSTMSSFSSFSSFSPIHYTLRIPEPQTHYLHVTLEVVSPRPGADFLELYLPVWTPGSYMVREYSRHIEGVEAFDESKRSLPLIKTRKNIWQVKVSGTITIEYRVYCNELTVRTNHIDQSHGYLNGAATFLYVPELRDKPHQVTVVPPTPDSDWNVYTALTPTEDPYSFIAEDYDTLVDSPIEMGAHKTLSFTVEDKPHQVVIWGRGNYKPEDFQRDIPKVVQYVADFFGGLPYSRYLFMVHLAAKSYGGLEHKNSTSLLYPGDAFSSQDGYLKFINLVAHEFFHTWNVKRLRPHNLDKFDYDHENYTTSLWFIEGGTSYYDELIPLRAGVYKAKHFLKQASQYITRLQNTPGRLHQSLLEGSYDAWIKQYRPDENSLNNQVSYYLKGQVLMMLVDLEIRGQTEGKSSLDLVFQRLWQGSKGGQLAYREEELPSTICRLVGLDRLVTLERYLDSTEDFDYTPYLDTVGLQLVMERSPLPALGVRTEDQAETVVVKSIERDSPAWFGGLNSGDVLLAIDNWRIHPGKLSDRLKDFKLGQTAIFTVFRRDDILNIAVTLGSPPLSTFTLVPVESPSAAQAEQYEQWLGEAHPHR
jgi:predicted metalloprotease with PDZ domain